MTHLSAFTAKYISIDMNKIEFASANFDQYITEIVCWKFDNFREEIPPN